MLSTLCSCGIGCESKRVLISLKLVKFVDGTIPKHFQSLEEKFNRFKCIFMTSLYIYDKFYVQITNLIAKRIKNGRIGVISPTKLHLYRVGQK